MRCCCWKRIRSLEGEWIIEPVEPRACIFHVFIYALIISPFISVSYLYLPFSFSVVHQRLVSFNEKSQRYPLDRVLFWTVQYELIFIFFYFLFLGYMPHYFFLYFAKKMVPKNNETPTPLSKDGCISFCHQVYCHRQK